VAIDHTLIKALHVEALRKQDLHAEHEPHEARRPRPRHLRRD
jgi:hypothetical protein